MLLFVRSDKSKSNNVPTGASWWFPRWRIRYCCHLNWVDTCINGSLLKHRRMKFSLSNSIFRDSITARVRELFHPWLIWVAVVSMKSLLLRCNTCVKISALFLAQSLLTIFHYGNLITNFFNDLHLMRDNHNRNSYCHPSFNNSKIICCFIKRTCRFVTEQYICHWLTHVRQSSYRCFCSQKVGLIAICFIFKTN